MTGYTRKDGYACEYDNYDYPAETIEVTPENEAEYKQALAEFWKEMDELYAMTH